MMKRMWFLAICFVLLAAQKAAADTLSKHAFEAAAEVFSFTYREPNVMRERGVLAGPALSYTYRDNIMLRLAGRAAFGDVDYRNSGSIDDISDRTFEVRGLAGYDFELSPEFTLTPYLGAGYRYLNDDSAGKVSSTGALGYERESNYVFIPVGAEAAMKTGPDWSITAAGEYDIFVWGKQLSHLSDAVASFSDLENKQSKGYGVRGSLKFQRHAETLDFIIEPFVRYWSIAQSEDSDVTFAGVIVGLGFEPKNNTTEYGIRLGVRF